MVYLFTENTMNFTGGDQMTLDLDVDFGFGDHPCRPIMYTKTHAYLLTKLSTPTHKM